MKLFSSIQIKAWDAFTIREESISSLELMERAANVCFEWIKEHFSQEYSFKVFCGRGNNGGDGLAISRMLLQAGYRVSVYVIGFSRGSNDFEENLERLKKIKKVQEIDQASDFPQVRNSVVIDALFGTGLNKKPGAIFSELITYLNENARRIISIDVPSGLFIDKSSMENEIINSDTTLTFQNYKLAFLMAENESHTGKVVLMDIGLSKEFEAMERPEFEMTDRSYINQVYRPRNPFTNKGDYGYACIVAGSYGMMGAAVLSARASLRTGVGKLTCYVPRAGYEIMQISVPEAMAVTYGDHHLEDVRKFSKFDVIGIGPGIGNLPSHKKWLTYLFTKFSKPVVVDADALNVLSKSPSLLKKIPAESIITPHPKEFYRLFGDTESDFATIQLALRKASEYHIYIVLKGHHTFIAAPDGRGYFNSTGNAGMATAGAGDVLTGIITGLLAQKYPPLEACLLGTYLHGLAGDLAAARLSEEALIAGDIIEFLPAAFLEIKRSCQTAL